MSALKKNGLLRTCYRDKLRTFRLTNRSKAYLLNDQPERFSFYLQGASDTNRPKSEITRRLRMCRIAETCVTMQNAGIAVFRDEKPMVFAPEGSPVSRMETPAFYSSREIKELGVETVKIRGARMVGTLLAPSGVFLTYNNGASIAKWDYRAELRAKALMKIVLCQQRLCRQYQPDAVYGLLLGDGMEPAYQLFASMDSGTRCYFLLDGNYEHFYYLTNDHRGEVILKLLCDPAKTTALDHILMQGLNAKKPGWLVENDAIDKDGNPVLFAYSFDMPRIVRFVTALQLQSRSGTLICFDFQAETLRRYCDERVSLQSISLEKLEGRFFS